MFAVAVGTTVCATERREARNPGRDVLVALGGEGEPRQQTARIFPKEFANAELVLNGDGGGGELSEDGRPIGYTIQASEKTYSDFAVTVTNSGGHSSRPGPSNAIYQLSADLTRLAAYRFPGMSHEITTASLKAASPAEPPGPVGDALPRFAATPNDH